MQAYSAKKSYAGTCKCYGCKRHKQGTADPIRRSNKKAARQQGKREAKA